MKKNVVIGFFGSQMDTGTRDSRWERWRPSLSLCAQENFPVAELHLLLARSEHAPMTTQLIVDIAKVSPQTAVVVHHLNQDDPWNYPETFSALHTFAHQFEFDEDVNYFVHLTTGTHTAQICLFALTESRHIPARMVDTFRINNPVGQDDAWRGRLEVIDLDMAAYDQLVSRFNLERQDSETLLKGGIATRNLAFNELISEIEKVCIRSTEPVLLTGPSGAGKTQLAKRIFELRKRRHLVTGNFVEVNCATLTKDSAMSMLFGHKKGAFTGAVTDRAGLLKSAAGGVLLLDEIACLGLDEQAMLLRAIEDKLFLPMGADTPVHSDFQLMAGTNVDLAAEVAAGRFREDLYFRINIWSFRLPGLAERAEDIEPNLDYELDRASASQRGRASFNSEARRKYLEFAHKAPWPGNFRDLSASVKRMATLAEGGRIRLQEVEREIARLEGMWPKNEEACASAALNDFALVAAVLPDADMDLFEKAHLEVVLRVIRDTSSMAEAGRMLFAVSRKERKSVNDSHRVRAMLASRGLDYKHVRAKLLGLRNLQAA